ncbi:MAG TPA: hypothetical protein VHP33_34170 [Polyangiaceae bacterium]|nr:hypothetical protein [Polyangiaceae bacterium]
MKSFATRVALLLLTLVCVVGCAFGIPLVPGAERVDVQRAAPPAGATRVKELRAVHGSGCGFLGGLGNYDGALATLRNLAQEVGADYVQITATQEPYSDGQCRHNEYVLQAVAYRIGAERAPAEVAKVDAAKPAKPDAAEAKSVAGVASSCPGVSVERVRDDLRFTGANCAYQLRAMPDDVAYELKFSARLSDGTAYAIWPGGAWNGGNVNAVGLVFDIAAGGIRLVRYAGSSERLELPKLDRALDRNWHTWRFARTRGRLIVWLDGQLLLVLAGNAQGGQMGLKTWGGVVVLRDLKAESLSGSQVAGYEAMGPLGWRGPGGSGVVAGDTAAPRPVAATPGKPSRMIGACNIDKLGWEDRSYPAAALTKKPVTLVKGRQVLTSHKVKPDSLMTLGQSEQGTELRYSGVQAVELDGQEPKEVLVNVSLGDFGIWHGNSVPPNPRSTEYAFRLSATCEPELLGSIDIDPDDTTRAEDNAYVRISGHGNKLKREEWRVQDGAFKLTAAQNVGREALEAPLPPCDEAKSSANLAGFAGRKGSALLEADSCVARRLKARLGKHQEEFWQYVSMGLSELESRDGYLVSGGCRVHVCGFNQAAFSVNIATGVVEAVIFEITVKPSLGSVKWLTATGKPLAPLKVSVDEAVERMR